MHKKLAIDQTHAKTESTRLAERLMSRRCEIGFSRAQLAQLTGVSYQCLSNWERAFPQHPHAKEATLARWLGFGPQALRRRQPLPALDDATRHDLLRRGEQQLARLVRRREVQKSMGFNAHTHKTQMRSLAVRQALGERAKDRRIALGMSMAQLAEKLNVSAAVIRSQEAALARSVRPRFEAAWEKCLDRPAGWLRSMPGAPHQGLDEPALVFGTKGTDLATSLLAAVCWCVRGPGRIHSANPKELTSRERRKVYIFLQYFGPGCPSLQAVGTEHGMSYEWVRRIISTITGNLLMTQAVDPLVTRLMQAEQALLVVGRKEGATLAHQQKKLDRIEPGNGLTAQALLRLCAYLRKRAGRRVMRSKVSKKTRDKAQDLLCEQ